MEQERRRQGTLTLHNRLVDAVLAGRFDEVTVNETTRFANALMRARDQWADANRHGRRYSDREQAQSEVTVRRRDGAR